VIVVEPAMSQERAEVEPILKDGLLLPVEVVSRYDATYAEGVLLSAFRPRCQWNMESKIRLTHGLRTLFRMLP
jgi:hypothetical protein